MCDLGEWGWLSGYSVRLVTKRSLVRVLAGTETITSCKPFHVHGLWCGVFEREGKRERESVCVCVCVCVCVNMCV